MNDIIKVLAVAMTIAIIATYASINSFANTSANDKPNCVYTVSADTMPSHAGKVRELDEKQKKLIYKHLKYPTEAQENNIQGRVTVQFIVETDGSISNVRVVRSAHPLLNEEAVRVIKSMPKFKPIIEGGKPIKEQFTMVVPFKLN